jgi:hypothetical protein
MEKIQVVVLGLSASPASNNAYALILKELEGNRRLPIIIGAFEAQAIALEMEGVVPPMPMTHDLIKHLVDSLGSNISEVVINELKDGTFYAKLIFDNPVLEVDARPSDAIAIAVRCAAPIFVNSEILDETGLVPQEQDEEISEEEDDIQYLKSKKESEEEFGKPKNRLEQLRTNLDKAIKDEDYEKAAMLRDELKKLSEN